VRGEPIAGANPDGKLDLRSVQQRVLYRGKHLSDNIAACRDGQRGSVILKRAESFQVRREEYVRRFTHQARLRNAHLHDVDGTQQRIRHRRHRVANSIRGPDARVSALSRWHTDHQASHRSRHSREKPALECFSRGRESICPEINMDPRLRGDDEPWEIYARLRV
jgi:hypothetical protein